MSDWLSESSSRELQTESLRIPAEMRDFLVQKLGIPEWEIDTIVQDSEFIPSIENLMKNPENNTEKLLFLWKYIYDKVITASKENKMDVLEYAQSIWKGEDYILKLDEYIDRRNKQANIEDQIRIMGKELVASEEENLRTNLLKTLELSTQRWRDSLSDEWKSELATLTEQKKQDPKFLEELKKQGYSEEEVRKMDDATISKFASWYVIVEQAENFAKKWYIRDRENYTEAVKGISDTLGIERRIPTLDNIPLPPSDRRYRVIQAWTELLKTGNYNENAITYNSRTGRITFEPNTLWGMKAEIDTSRMPPILEYVRGSLRIGRDIPPANPKLKEKQLLEEKKGKLSESLKKDIAVPFVEIGEAPEYAWIPKKITETSRSTVEAHKKNQTDLSESIRSNGVNDPTGTLEIIKRLKESNQKLDQARLEGIDMENLSDPKMRSLEEWLYREYTSLQSLERTLTQIVQNTGALKPYEWISSNADSWFESVAKWLLSRLDEMGYTILWQKNLDRIMAALTYRRPGIWNTESLDTYNAWTRDMQLRDLDDVARKITDAYPGTPKTRQNAFQEILRRMESINTWPIMENLWSQPIALSQWLGRLGLSEEGANKQWSTGGKATPESEPNTR